MNKHSYNQRTFLSGAQSDQPLLALYCNLVAIELALKDSLRQRDGKWRGGHDLKKLLKEYKQSFSSKATELADKLEGLSCTDMDGSQAPIKIKSYPEMRYLQHNEDFNESSSDNERIYEALKLAQKITGTLQKEKVLYEFS